MTDAEEIVWNLEDVLFTIGVSTALTCVLCKVAKLKRRGSLLFTSVPTSHVGVDGVDLEKWPGGTLTIYFGSQTGTAECFAHIIAAEGIEHGFKTTVVDLEDFSEKQLLDGGKAIFVMATYGKGDPTDNAQRFFSWLANKDQELTSDFLDRLHYTVFGLGNTQYEKYNLVGRTTYENLRKIGAKRMYRYGEGDDDAELEEDFEAWKARLWGAIVEQFGGKEYVDGLDKAKDLSFSLKMLTKDEAATVERTAESKAAYARRFHWHAVNTPVILNRELRANMPGVGSTRHIEIDLGGSGVSYHTADNLAVLPLNDAAIAEKLCTHLGYDSDAIFTLEYKGDTKPIFPTPCTVRDAFVRFMDIMSVPRRSLLEQLTPYVADEVECRLMHRMSSKDGRDEYHCEVEDAGRSLACLIMEAFSSISIPLEHFLHIVPHIRPRYYTISSSSSVFPSSVHITVAVLEQEKTQGRVYRGICSSFLSKLVPNGGVLSDGAHKGPQCRVFVRESKFRLPADTTVPIVMIGPGTGVAPMRALLQERAWQKAQGSKVGRNVLYFGCRRRDQDYIYKVELEGYKADGTLDTLRLAFSREGPSKVYVQHLLREDAAEVWRLIRGGAYVYVCGGTRMGTDVHTELTRIAQDLGSMREEQSNDFMRDLVNSGRYVQEFWS